MPTKTPEEVLIEIIPRLAEFSRRASNKYEHEKAVLTFWNVFRHIESAEALEGDNETRFMDWFLFDFRTQSGKYLWEEFVGSEKVAPEEEDILRRVEKSRLGLYEVGRVEPKTGAIELDDLLTGEHHAIRDSQLSRRLGSGEILYSRLLGLDGEGYLTGAPLVLPAGMKADLLEFVQENLSVYLRREENASVETFLKDEGFLINHYLTEYDQAQNDDHESRLFQMSYIPIDEPAVLDLLDSEPTLEQHTGRGNKWLLHGRDDHVRAWLTLDGDCLNLYALTKSDFEEGCVRIEGILGPMLPPGEELTQGGDEFEMLSIPGVPNLDPDLVSGETEDEYLQNYFEAYYDRWLDTPVPDLQNRTPREVSRTPGGQARLESLLQKMEELQFREAFDSSFSYDFDRIRRKLGLIPSDGRKH